MNTHECIRSLNSTLCPACGARKQRSRTLCSPCYHGLPQALRRALWDRVGDGYEQAVASALRHLGASTPSLPKE